MRKVVVGVKQERREMEAELLWEEGERRRDGEEREPERNEMRITGVGSVIQQHHPHSLHVEVFQLLVVGQRDAAIQST